MNKILIVDDSRFFLSLVESLLDRWGCKMLTATNAENALKLIDSEKPRIILLDLHMPHVTGDKLCKIVKSKPEYEEIIIIMLIASNKQADIDKCFKAGCNDYITKPIDKENLLNSIGKYIPMVKRNYERAPIYESVKYYHNNAEYSGHIHVISQGGAFIMGEHMVPPESVIKLIFSISKMHESMEIIGKVAWNFDSKEKFPQLLATAQGMGVQFIKISDSAKSAIIKYMALGNFMI
ncbi:MAG: response regulator [Deltaproteobacteria bacterium]|nr:response regulator [Deltaproteobacteria bacterium]